MHIVTRLLATLVATICLIGAPVRAATLNVTNLNDSGAGSLRAILAGGAPGDTVQFASGVTGTIALASSLSITKNITILGPGSGSLTLDGQGTVRVIDISTASTVALSNLTIANGRSAALGGGINTTAGVTLTLSDCVFSGNRGANGGGINVAAGSTLSVSACTFQGNVATAVGGGAIFTFGTATVTGSTFIANTAPINGGAFNVQPGGTLTLTNSTLSGNTSGGLGGALSNLGTVTMINNTFAGNQGSSGSVFATGSDTVTLSNNVFMNNASSAGSGAINPSPVTYTASNNVFFNNTVTGVPDDAAGYGSTNFIVAAAAPLGALGNNGGTTQSMAPVASSAALCAGSVAIVPSGLTLDQRGFPRVTSVNGVSCVDAGSVQTVPAPTVTLINPTSGPTAGGTSVTITGTNFTGASGATAVKFGSTNAASYTVNSATQITASSPAGSAGIVDITVTTAGGTSATSASDQFTYVAAPTVTGINPTSGPTAGGTSVVITGTNFTGASGAAAVKFGSTNAASYTVNSATQITASSPPGSAGIVDITVTTAGGTSATSASDQFTYVAAPTVTGINPTYGPTAGGTSVTITGTNLGNATGVTIGGNACTFLSANTATSVTCTTAAHAAGTVSVLVTTVGGTNSANTLFAYTVRQTPAINTAVGGGTVVAQIVSGSAGCSIDLNNTTAFTPPSFNGTTPPYGGLKLKLTGCNPGETVQVSTTWPNMAGLTFQKYGPTPTSSGNSIYYTPNGVSVAGNTVTYSITDNGLGDDTFTGADGVINDPAVPVSLAAIAAGIPTLSEWGLIILSALLALGTLVVMRRRQM